MKLITFHHRNVNVSYKNSLCSMASVFYLGITIAAVVIPLYLVLLLSPRVWLESVLIWEQPSVQFKYQYNFIGTRLEGKTVACSSYPYQRSLIDAAKEKNTTRGCSTLKVSDEDWNNDGRIDEIEFQVKTPGQMKQISLQLIFDLKLEKFCNFQNIPTVLLFSTDIPSDLPLTTNLFQFDLRLSQKVSFNCPILFRHQETHFKPLNLSSHSADDYTPLSIHRRIDRNPGHFHFEHSKSFHDPTIPPNTFKFSLKTPQVMIRFETPTWHKIFHVWIKFVSLYIFFFFAAKRIKDYAYGNYWIRSWEVIPWKKIY